MTSSTCESCDNLQTALLEISLKYAEAIQAQPAPRVRAPFVYSPEYNPALEPHAPECNCQVCRGLRGEHSRGCRCLRCLSWERIIARAGQVMYECMHCQRIFDNDDQIHDHITRTHERPPGGRVQFGWMRGDS